MQTLGEAEAGEVNLFLGVVLGHAEIVNLLGGEALLDEHQEHGGDAGTHEERDNGHERVGHSGDHEDAAGGNHGLNTSGEADRAAHAAADGGADHGTDEVVHGDGNDALGDHADAHGEGDLDVLFLGVLEDRLLDGLGKQPAERHADGRNHRGEDLDTLGAIDAVGHETIADQVRDLGNGSTVIQAADPADDEAVKGLLALVKTGDEVGQRTGEHRDRGAEHEEHDEAAERRGQQRDDHHGHKRLRPLGNLEIGLDDERDVAHEQTTDEAAEEAGVQERGNHAHEEAGRDAGTVGNGVGDVATDECRDEAHAHAAERGERRGHRHRVEFVDRSDGNATGKVTDSDEQAGGHDERKQVANSGKHVLLNLGGSELSLQFSCHEEIPLSHGI